MPTDPARAPVIRPTTMLAASSVPEPIVKTEVCTPERPVCEPVLAWAIESVVTLASSVPAEKSAVDRNDDRAPTKVATLPIVHEPTGLDPSVPRSTSAGFVSPVLNRTVLSERPPDDWLKAPMLKAFDCPRSSTPPPPSLLAETSATATAAAVIVLTFASVRLDVPGAPELLDDTLRPTRTVPAGFEKVNVPRFASESTSRWPAVTLPLPTPPGPTSKLPGPVSRSAPAEPLIAMPS